MSKMTSFRLDEETIQRLEDTAKKLKTSKSDVLRMAIAKFKNYVDKVNK